MARKEHDPIFRQRAEQVHQDTARSGVEPVARFVRHYD
ncbi:hypothetical protein MYA_3247 [Burkholderia sp. KJ006]|nr:hypothetical protein MYA_3247 [Burkholderia sp. KJ006]